MKVLLTGGNGFIGSWTAQRLYERGHQVVIFDRHFKHGHSVPVENYLGDITDANAVTEAMAHCEAFIHLAGVLGTAETIKDPRPAAWTNIQGGLNVLEAASQYDIPGVNIAVGNHWMNNTYSITKSTVERFAQMFRDERGLRVTNLRALNAYGPGQSVAAPYGDSKVRKIMPAFACRALSGKDIEVYGDGTQIMDMIHVSDVAEALVRAVEYTATNGPVKHVIQAGSGNPTTVNDIAWAVRREAYLQSGHSVNVVHLPMRAGEPDKSIVLGDPSTMDILDMPKLITLEDGLVGALEYFSELSEDTMKKIIHRIWIGPAEMPAEYKEFGLLWKKMNPDWQVFDWDEASLALDNVESNWINAAVISDLLKQGEQPGADKVALATHLADVLAYELVYRFGGLYVNTDMQPVRELSVLFDAHPELAVSPAAGREDDHWVVNAVLWAPEDYNDFWLAVIKQLPSRYFGMPGEYMSNTTGPHLLTQVYNGRKDLIVLDKSVFNPIHFSQVNYGEDAKFDMDDLPPETITVHHWGHRRNRRNQRVLEPS